MNKCRFSLAFLVGAILMLSPILSGCQGSQQANQSNQNTQALTISAASSLKRVMTEIQTSYHQSQPDTKITYNFGGSGGLQQQIEQGAKVDIFISAAPKQMNELAKKALIIESTRRNLLTNRVVLVVPKSSSVDSFDRLVDPSVKKIAIGEPNSVPAGTYAQETLTSLKLFDRLKPKLIFTKDVSQVLAYVNTQNVDAGIVYATDAKDIDTVKVVATVNPRDHSPLVYPGAIVKSTQNLDSAKKFLDYLSTPGAQKVFEKYGFITNVPQ